MKTTNNNRPQWMIDFDNDKFGKSISENKETAYGSWENFEKETGMTKAKYFEKESKNIID